MTAPFETMKAIYVYFAAFIGLLLVASGFYTLLEYLLNLFFGHEQFNAIFIVTPFVRIIVGLFVMIPHWAIGHHFHICERQKKSRR